MTDTQNMLPKGGWQEPTVSVQVFADRETKIQVERVQFGTGAWLSFRGDATMTGVSICMNNRETVERIRDALSEWLG